MGRSPNDTLRHKIVPHIRIVKENEDGDDSKDPRQRSIVAFVLEVPKYLGAIDGLISEEKVGARNVLERRVQVSFPSIALHLCEIEGAIRGSRAAAWALYASMFAAPVIRLRGSNTTLSIVFPTPQPFLMVRRVKHPLRHGLGGGPKVLLLQAI